MIIFASHAATASRVYDCLTSFRSRFEVRSLEEQPSLRFLQMLAGNLQEVNHLNSYNDMYGMMACQLRICSWTVIRYYSGNRSATHRPWHGCAPALNCQEWTGLMEV